MEKTAGTNGKTATVDGQDLSLTSLVVASKEQLSCDLVGEAVILNMKTGVYYGLDSVGAMVWTLLQEPRRVSEIVDTVLTEYDVEPDRCERDLLNLLTGLKAVELIEVGEAELA